MTTSGNKKTGAVIYTRVSGGEQDKHGTSPETQLRDCRAKALALGLPIISEYYDPAISGGFLLSRPGMMAAIADIQAGRADTLICANMSRYSRDVEHQQALKKSVRAAGGRIVFCDMAFDDTPAGDLAFTVMGGFAQWERQEIGRRTRGGRNARAEAGIQPARTHSPFGYRVVSKADILRGDQPADMAGRYVVVDSEAPIAATLFERYAAGRDSLTTLTRWLNEMGIPTRQGAAFWSVSSLAYILTNPIYKGVGVYGRKDHIQDEARLSERHPHTGQPLKSAKFSRPAAPETWITFPVPALVSEETWDAVQERQAENRRLKGGNPKRARMLAGRVFCPECEAGLICRRTDTRAARRHPEREPRRFYACGQYLRRLVNVGERGCVPTHYDIDRVETDVMAILDDAARRRDIIQAVIRAAVAADRADKGEDTPGEAPQELMRVEAALRDTEARQAATVKAQIAGIVAGLPADAYTAAFAEIAAQRASLEERRRELTQAQPAAPARREWTAADFPRILADVRRTLTSPDIPGEEKRDAIGTLIEKVYPTKDGVDVLFLSGVFGDETLQPYLFSRIRAASQNPARRGQDAAESPSAYTPWAGLNPQERQRP